MAIPVVTRGRWFVVAAIFVIAAATAGAALLGVVPGVPTTAFTNPGTTTYSATTHLFSVTATPTTEAFGGAIGTRTIAAPRGLTINIQVDNSGALIGGVAGNDLTLTGSIDSNGDGTPEYSGALLTGEILAFGSQNVGGADVFDFRFGVTGGALASLYGSDEIGVRLTSESSTFTGSFATNFTGRAKGTIGPVPPLASGQIGDFVWQDTNANGIQDAGEPGIQNVRVWLKDSGGNILQTQITGASGNYLFSGLSAGLYTVEVDGTTIPAGFLTSPPYQGGSQGADSNSTPQSVSLTGGEHNLTIDFGYYPPCSGVIGDIVWNDLDRDGIQDAGEAGLDGVTVELLDSSMNVIKTATTAAGPLDQNGYYQFTGLCSGTYYVRVDTTTIPPGFLASPPLAGTNTAVDSNPQPTTVVLMTNSSTDNTIDFGYNLPADGRIGNFVWNDANRDGIQDIGETGIAGVRIWLRDVNTDAILQTTTTSGTGFYQFNGLTAGSYKLEVDTTTVPPGFVASPTEQSGDTGLDSNPNGWIATLPTDWSSDLTVDFGFNAPCSGTIGSVVWNDQDRDGIQDVGEPGLVGISIQLIDPSTNTVLRTTTTGANGVYTFSGVCTGTYEVRVDTSTLAPGFVASPSLQGSDTALDSNGSPATVTLATDSSSDLTIDFGYNTPCSGAIGNFVWEDLNQNGLQDGGEPGIGGVTLYLYDSSHTRIASAITSDGGAYQFTGVCAGSYTVEVEPTTLPAGMLSSPSLQGSNTALDSNGAPAAVTLATDSSTDNTIDFGYYASLPSISIVKYTNGQEAGVAPGPSIVIGGTVTWTYEVANTGNVVLTGVTVVDNMGVTVTCPENTLGIGDSMTCTGSGIATSGQYENVGTASATAPGGPVVTESNASHYFGVLPPGIAITKTATPTSAYPFQPITYSYTVTNTGGITLTNITVTDDNSTPAVTADDFTVGTIATLAPGDSTTLTKVVTPVTNTVSEVLGGVGPSSGFAVLSLGGDASHTTAGIKCSNAVVTGNIGVVSYGNFNNMAACSYAAGATFYRGTNVTSSGWGARPIVADETYMNRLRQDAFNASTYFAGLTATQTVPGGTITNTMTLTGVAGINVVDITTLQLAGGETLTLNGPVGTQWVFNVSTKFYLDGSTIALGPNITTADVVWNVARGATFGTHGNNTFRGIVLAPYTGGTIFDLGPADGMFVGGYNQLVTLMSGTHITAPTAPPPTVVNTATATVTVNGSTLTATDTATVTLDK